MTAVDDKKAEQGSTNTGGSNGSGNHAADYPSFLKNLLFSLIFTIGLMVFVLGGMGLFTAKVAQANLLPDNVKLAPFSSVERIVKDMPIDLHVMRASLFSENADTLSQKAVFNSQAFLRSFQHGWLCSLKQSSKPDVGGVLANPALFFHSVYASIMASSFMAVNQVFLPLNYLPESFTMMLYGFFGVFLWMGLYAFNVCTSVFYHLVHIPQLFRRQVSNQWEDTKDISFFRFSKALLFFFVWAPTACLSAFVSPAVFTLHGLLAPLFATYRVVGSPPSSASGGLGDFLKNTFAYKKFMFFVLATLSLFSNGSKYLGTSGVVGITVAVVVAYFIGLYDNPLPLAGGPEHFTAKIKQSIRKAPVLPPNHTAPPFQDEDLKLPRSDTIVAKKRATANKHTTTQEEAAPNPLLKQLTAQRDELSRKLTNDFVYGTVNPAQTKELQQLSAQIDQLSKPPSSANATTSIEAPAASEAPRVEAPATSEAPRVEAPTAAEAPAVEAPAASEAPAAEAPTTVEAPAVKPLA